MFTLPGYQIRESVYRSVHTTVFSARRDDDELPVIIKLCHEEGTDTVNLGRAQREYMLLQNLSSDYLPQFLECVQCAEGHALIMADEGGQPLDRLLADNRLSQDDCLIIAQGAAEALGSLHAQGIIHRDLRLENLIYNPGNKRVQLIDLDQATRLARELVPLRTAVRFIGHPNYVAPEQTGRISRAVDYRGDFYSLGACLYHLFCGQPPFEAADMAGLLHAHIARRPTPPHSLRPELSPALSAIICKLLEKSPDDRYQSAFGLMADLRTAASLQPDQAAQFTPGNQDVAGRFRILDRLYGRDAELVLLREDYRKARDGHTRLTLIAGAAGIGKTVLVEALREHVVEDEGYFVTGKFDQLKRNEPYLGPIQALTSLVGQILSEDDTQVALWRKHILDTMGDTCAALSNLIPELKAITGVLPVTGQVAGSEAMHRFNTAVRLLLQAISTFGKPVVLFLDDLQWADTPSLRTLSLMLRDAELAHIHVIGAYRDEQVDESHPVKRLIQGLEEQTYEFTRLSLNPLDSGDVANLLADTLSHELGECVELAHLLHERTGGNPFFIRQMLQHWYKEGLFDFDPQAGRWRWALPRITEAGYTSDVAEFMAGQLQALSQDQQTLLQIAACIGGEFRLDLLAQASETIRAEVVRELWSPLDKGLISMSGIDSGLLLIQDTASLERLLRSHDVRFRFNHDRIQEAADQQLEDQHRTELHLRIARLLNRQTIADHDSHRLFNLVSHYNRAASLLDAKERLAVAKLNLRAGIAVKRAGAHEVAYSILREGLKQLPDHAWTDHYRLSLDMHQEAAELACLTADYPAMQALIDNIEQQAHTPLDKLPSYETRIQAEIAQNRPYQAVNTAIPLLAEFGLRLPSHPRTGHVLQSFLRTRLMLAGKPLAKLQALPPMQDPNYLAGVRLLSKVVSAAYFSSPLMLPLIILLLVRLSLREGLSALSPFGFAGYSALVCGAGKRADAGLAYGQLGLALASKPAYAQYQNRAQFLFGHYTEHWSRPLQETCDTLQAAFEASLRIGDQEFTAYPAALYCMHAYFAGKGLENLAEDLREYGAALGKTQHETAQRWHDIYTASVAILVREDSEPAVLTTQHCDEARVEQIKPSAKDAGVGFHYRLNKLMLCYWFADYEQAEHYRVRAAVDLPYLVATPFIPVYHQFSALVSLARYRGNQDARLLRLAHGSLRLMRGWSAHCPENFDHKAWLIEAEMARCHNQGHDAMEAYEKAIDGARRHGYQNDEALACELAGEYCLQRGQDKLGQYFLQQAVAAWRRWGALRKVKHIKERYPQVAEALELQRSVEEFDPRLVDIESVLKSARALSSEILLPRLISKLMGLVMENSGAQRAILLTRRDRELYVQTECTAEQNPDAYGPPRPLADDRECLANSIVQYVARTHQSIVLADAQREGQFRHDHYVRQHASRSLLCLPMLKHGELTGMLYLENNLISGAFTAERLELLNVLCAQAAISLENARLYKNITDLNEAYERFVPHDMISLLHRQSILDVQLGDQVQGEMTPLFSDIRAFTTLSEQMSPAENFAFLNEYLGRMAPVIRDHRGFVNRYVGDALLAIFPQSPDDAVTAAINMLKRLENYNAELGQRLPQPLRIGIGINTGPMMLGTVGEPDRMEGSILSDAVNIAARLETLTKTFQAPLLISGDTEARLSRRSAFASRYIGDVRLRGREAPVALHEVFDADPEEIRLLKRETQVAFDLAVRAAQRGDNAAAAAGFREVMEHNPNDSVASVLWESCQHNHPAITIQEVTPLRH